MDDFDNLPFTTSPIDGINAGVNKWDDPFTANGKVQLYELEKRNAKLRELNSADEARRLSNKDRKDSINLQNFSDAFTSNSSPSYDSETLNTIISCGFMPVIRQGNIMSVSEMPRLIDSRHRELRKERLKTTAFSSQLRKAAFIGCLISGLIVLVGLKLPFISYKYLDIEYLSVRMIFIGSIFLIFKTSLTIKKSITSEEKKIVVMASCMIDAAKRVRAKNKSIKNGPHSILFGRFQFPAEDLSAKFLYQFNKLVLKKTGESMPFTVHRFRYKELWNNAFFIPMGSLDVRSASLADNVSLAELELLAKQSP